MLSSLGGPTLGSALHGIDRLAIDGLGRCLTISFPLVKITAMGSSIPTLLHIPAATRTEAAYVQDYIESEDIVFPSGEAPKMRYEFESKMRSTDGSAFKCLELGKALDDCDSLALNAIGSPAVCSAIDCSMLGSVLDSLMLSSMLSSALDGHGGLTLSSAHDDFGGSQLRSAFDGLDCSAVGSPLSAALDGLGGSALGSALHGFGFGFGSALEHASEAFPVTTCHVHRRSMAVAAGRSAQRLRALAARRLARRLTTRRSIARRSAPRSTAHGSAPRSVALAALCSARRPSAQ